MLDAKIFNGDVAVDSGGNALRLCGADAVFQRAVITLTVPRGSFVYDRALGTPLFDSEQTEKQELCCLEGLAKYDYKHFYIAENDGSRMVFGVTVNDESREEEVRRYGSVS